LNRSELPLFETLFKEYFEELTRFALKYLGDLDESKNIVHDVFINLWEKSKELDPDINYKSYLYTAVRNRSLNAIRDNKKLVDISIVSEAEGSEYHDVLIAKELEREIEFALNTLPKKCREVFHKSRQEGLKYSEIALEMSISIKTVEAQMSKALKILRVHLAEFLSIILFVFLK
jgi:RNA polymerase sigma-70 factor (ECF subfamily)